jgi:CheY-like chemotaxis protein
MTTTRPLRPILLAEDNPADVELTITALRRLGVSNEVVVVGDGAETLDFLERRGRFASRASPQPALIILDLKMPRLNGLQVLEYLRKTPELRLLPVVMFTSSREQHDICRSYELGGNAYVVKPLDFQEFMRTVGGLGTFWTECNEPGPDRS